MAEDQAVVTTEQVGNVAESPAFDASLDAGAALDANVEDAANAVAEAEAAGAPDNEIDRLKAELKRTKDQLAGYRGRVKEEVKRETEALTKELSELKGLMTRQQQADARRAMEAQQQTVAATVNRALNDKFNELVQAGFGDAEASQMARQFAGIVERELQLRAMQDQLNEQDSVNQVAAAKAAMTALVEEEIDAYAARIQKRDGVEVDLSPRRVLREIEERYKGRPKVGPAEVVRVVRDLMDDLADERLKGSKLTAEQRAALRESKRAEARATGSQQFETGGSPTVDWTKLDAQLNRHEISFSQYNDLMRKYAPAEERKRRSLY